MVRMTATALRRELFATLGKVAAGQSVSIVLGGQEVARLVPGERQDWRVRVRERPKVKGSVERAFAPLPDWEGHA